MLVVVDYRVYWTNNLINYNNYKMKAIQTFWRRWFPCSLKIHKGFWKI